MAVSRLRAQDQDRRRAAIRDATRTVIAEGGIEAATVRAIAAQAGQSVATLYNLIGSRPEILAAVLEDLSADVNAAMIPNADAEPIEQLRHTIESAVACIVKRKQLFAPLIVELGPDLGGDEAVRQSFIRSVEVHRAIIDQAISDRLLLDDLDGEYLARAVVRAIAETQQRWAVGHLSNTEFQSAALQSAGLVWLAVVANQSARREILQATGLMRPWR